MSHVRRLVVPALILLLYGCGEGPAGPPLASYDDSLRIRFSLQALGEVPRPPGDPFLAERVDLGRLLFFDPILGGEKDVSCGTCHHPGFAFADGRALGAGVSGRGLGPGRQVSTSSITGLPIPLESRSSPTVLNAAFNSDSTGRPGHLGLQFWDGRAAGLEEQARGPITSRTEMAGDAYPSDVARDSVVARLRAIAEYVQLFKEAFPAEAVLVPGSDVITMDTYGRAVAAYERELVTRSSPYDRFVRGENDAMTTRQKAGLELFFTRAACASCHSGPMFSDYSFRVLGVPQTGPGGTTLPGDDVGREEFTGDPADRRKFRTPTLRNVELTAPYMHDGVFVTLEEVVGFYNRSAHPRHNSVSDEMVDPLVRTPLGLSDNEIGLVVDFLKALTDPGTGLDPTLLSVPLTVPSGLPPVIGVGTP